MRVVGQVSLRVEGCGRRITGKETVVATLRTQNSFTAAPTSGYSLDITQWERGTKGRAQSALQLPQQGSQRTVW